MQITLNIDASNFGDTIAEVFQHLTVEQKQELAKQALTKWLEEPYTVEYSVKKEEIFNQLRLKETVRDINSWTDIKTKDATDLQLERSREFKELIANWKSSKQIMVEETTKIIVDYYKNYAKEFIEKDEQTQKVLQEAIAKVTEQYPATIHDAIMFWFAGYMNTIQSSVAMALHKSENSESISKQLAQQITGRSY